MVDARRGDIEMLIREVRRHLVELETALQMREPDSLITVRVAGRLGETVIDLQAAVLERQKEASK